MNRDNEQYITELHDVLFDDDNVLFVYVFGSIIEKKNFRDIDVAVFFQKPPRGYNYLQYASRLDCKINFETDLIILNRASAFLRHNIVKTGRLLFVKNKLAFWKFREQTIDDYQEYKYISGMDKYD